MGVGLIGLVGAHSAGAAATIGSDLQDAPNSTGVPCNASRQCTVRQAGLNMAAQAPNGITSPITGVVVRWRIKVGATTGPVSFRVLRPAGGPGQFTGAGTFVPPVTPPINTTSAHAARMPIQAGDSIGINCCQASDITFIHTAGGIGGIDYWGTGATFPLADGEPPRLPSLSAATYELLLNADIEPDVDGDGFGDETQDQCPGAPGPENGCPSQADPGPKADGTLTIDASKGKVEKGRKVTLSGRLDVATDEACERNRQIQIQRRKKSQPDSAFATFETVQTDAAGDYSTREKVKKTYLYRAVVSETEACEDEISNSRKVRVQKK